jgi:FGGY-family pentulose kinase
VIEQKCYLKDAKMTPYLLSVDGGTESARAALFTLDGKMIESRAVSYPLRHPRPGWAEQNPDDWWHAICGAVRETVSAAGISPNEIIAISGDFTCCTVVFLDSAFHPLRPAIIWMDVRSAEQTRRIAASGYPALKYNGFGNVSAEWMPCKALWVKENEPDIWAQTRYLGEYNDWCMHRLTGEWAGSVNNASVRWYYDHGFPADFYNGIGLGDALEKFPKRILKLGDVVGTLTQAAASDLGLRAGIPVGQGGADALVAMIGLGVVEPGKMAFILGSSHLHLGQSAHAFHGKGMFGAYTDAVIPGLYVVEGGQISTGSVVRWFRDHFCGGYGKGGEVYTMLNEEASRLPPGSEGLIVLEYWQGNRTPHVDPEARGMIWGLTLAHSNAHIFRAIIEGIAYGTEAILRTFRQHDYGVRELVATGGPTKSRLWMQIHADVSNVPITLTEAGDSAALLGSAALAAVAGGVYATPVEASRAMVRVKDCIEPNPEVNAAYQFYIDQYLATYPQMRDLMHTMTRQVANA